MNSGSSIPHQAHLQVTPEHTALVVHGNSRARCGGVTGQDRRMQGEEKTSSRSLVHVMNPGSGLPPRGQRKVG